MDPNKTARLVVGVLILSVATMISASYVVGRDWAPNVGTTVMFGLFMLAVEGPKKALTRTVAFSICIVGINYARFHLDQRGVLVAVTSVLVSTTIIFMNRHTLKQRRSAP
jgi:hypothetical protein